MSEDFQWMESRYSTCYLWNYRTKSYDVLPDTPEDWSDYVPQIGGRSLYQIYVSQGIEPVEAAQMVLERIIEHDARRNHERRRGGLDGDGCVCKGAQ